LKFNSEQPNVRHHPPAREIEDESRAVAGRVHAVVRLAADEKRRLHFTATTAQELKLYRRGMPRNFIPTHVQNQQRIRVEHDHIFNALRKVELRPNLKVFSLIPFANHFNYCLRHELNSFLFLFRLPTKNRDVWPLQRAIGETDINV
jgi:hypothetical protein